MSQHVDHLKYFLMINQYVIFKANYSKEVQRTEWQAIVIRILPHLCIYRNNTYQYL